MTQKTIVFFCQNFFPTRGGIQTLLHNMCLAVQKNSSWKVVLITLTPSGDRQENFPYEVIRIPCGKNLTTRGLVFLRLYRILSKIQPDHILLGYWSRYAGLFPILCRYFSVTFSVVIHGKEITFSRKGKGYRSFKKGADKAAFIIANSSYTRSVYEKIKLSPPALVMNPGLNYDLFCIDPLERRRSVRNQQKNKGTLKLLFVGRLVKRKGADHLINALALLREKQVPVHLTIVGSGQEFKRLELLVQKYRISEYVTFCNQIENEKLYDIYCQNDLFVMPSRNLPATGDYEGFGIVYLEANYFGLPAIGGNEGGVPDAIHDGINGFLCDPHSPEDIAEKILYAKERMLGKDELHEDLLHYLDSNFHWDRLIQPVIKKINESGG